MESRLIFKVKIMVDHLAAFRTTRSHVFHNERSDPIMLDGVLTKIPPTYASTVFPTPAETVLEFEIWESQEGCESHTASIYPEEAIIRAGPFFKIVQFDDPIATSLVVFRQDFTLLSPWTLRGYPAE